MCGAHFRHVIAIAIACSRAAPDGRRHCYYEQQQQQPLGGRRPLGGNTATKEQELAGGRFRWDVHHPRLDCDAAPVGLPRAVHVQETADQ